jgi:O-antigen ligase
LAFALFLIPIGRPVGIAVLWLSLFVLLLTRRPPPAPAVLWSLAAFIAYCLATGLAARYLPTPADQPLAHALTWIQLTAFVPVAYALRGDQALLLRLWLLALLGLFLGMLWRAHWGSLLNDLDGYLASRPGFGFPALAFALYSGTALLGLGLLRERCWRGTAGRLIPWRIALWTLAVAVLFQGFVLTQARGALLALVFCGGVALALAWRDRRRRRVARTGLLPGLLSGVLIATVLTMALVNAPVVVERFAAEARDLEALAAGQLAYSPKSSVSLRWHALVFGMERWQEAPWLGWGPGASRPLMLAAEAPEVRTEEGEVLQHLHNSYLEFAVQFGAVGLLLLGAFCVALVVGLRRAVADGTVDTDLGRFILLALLFCALWSLFNYRALTPDWRAYFALLAGAALSFAIYRPTSVRGAPAGARGR